MRAVILAAGASSRFFPFSKNTHKASLTLCGKSIISWTIEALKKSAVSEVVVVVSPEDKALQEILKSFKGFKITQVYQREPKGMGHALLCAKKHLEESFLVLFPYHIDAEKIIPKFKKKFAGVDGVVLASRTAEPWKYGILKLKGSRAVGIVEKPAKGSEPSRTKICGFYLLKKTFVNVLERTRESEYQFEEALSSYMQEGKVEIVRSSSDITLKHPWDLFKIRDYLLARLSAKRAKTAKVAKTATIEGKVILEEGAQVHDYALVQGPCYIGKNAVVGAYSILRDNSVLEEGAEIQRYVDCARSILGPDSQIHSGFVGDSILGSGVRIGAGFVTANRRIDRANIEVEVRGEKVPTENSYLGALIGDNVRTGVNVTLMPGVVVGPGAVIGPNSVVFKNVPEKTLFYVDYKKTAVVKRLK